MVAGAEFIECQQIAKFLVRCHTMGSSRVERKKLKSKFLQALYTISGCEET